jgi:hypothetical protein
LVARSSNVDENVDVRISPIYRRNDAVQRQRLTVVELGVDRVMRETSACKQGCDQRKADG